MKITTSRLRQIIQEELAAHMHEQSDGLLSKLIQFKVPWLCRSGQTECLKKDWADEVIKSEPGPACGEVLINVWSYLTGTRFPMGLSDEERAAMEGPKVKKLLKNLAKAAGKARKGRLSPRKMESLLEYWVADEKTADSFRKTTTFGSEHLNVGLGT